MLSSRMLSTLRKVVPITGLATSQIVKYLNRVHIVTRRHPREAMETYPDASVGALDAGLFKEP